MVGRGARITSGANSGPPTRPRSGSTPWRTWSSPSRTGPTCRTLLAGAATDATAPAARRAWALETMARSRLSPLPGPWVEALAGSLRDPEPSVRRAAVRSAAVLQVPQLDPTLLALADDPGEPPDLRLEALRAALPRHPEPSPAAFDLLIGQLGAQEARSPPWPRPSWRAGSRLDDSRRLRLLDAVRGSALVTPPTLRAAFAPPIGDEAAAAWVDYLEASLRAGWRPPEADLRALLEAVPVLSPERRAALLRMQRGGTPDRRARLAEFEPLLPAATRAGAAPSSSARRPPARTCHRVGDEGGRVGPDLTRIGAIRSGHDLLESILWPSSTFAQGYEPYTVATADGRVLARPDRPAGRGRRWSSAIPAGPRPGCAATRSRSCAARRRP